MTKMKFQSGQQLSRAHYEKKANGLKENLFYCSEVSHFFCFVWLFVFCIALQSGGTHPICWLTTEHLDKTKVYRYLYQIECIESIKINLFEVTACGRPTLTKPQETRTNQRFVV